MIVTNQLSLPAAGVTNSAGDIHGIKPPIAIPNYWLWIIIGLVAIVVLAGVVTALILWLRKKAVPPVIPIDPPHVRARQRLVEALALIGQPRPFCILVSDTVRLYLEERFNFRAPERTTEEFLHELKATELLMPDQKQSLGEFLEVCDLVKFARYEPGPPELQALHGAAVRLVDETEPQPVVPAPPSVMAENQGVTT
jgi:hypothetical protein